MAEPVLTRRDMQAAVTVRDGDEVAAGAFLAECLRGRTVEVMEERKRLDRAAGLGGDDEERRPQIEGGGEFADGIGMGGIDDGEVEEAIGGAKDFAEDVRGET